MRIFGSRTDALLIIVLAASLFCAQEAKLIYKNGTELNCMIENYEIGKYAEIIDDKGNKRIVSWDNINEIIFANEEEKPETQSPNEPELITAPAVAPAVPAAPAAVLPAPQPEPVVVPVAEPKSASTGGGSMLDQFKKNRTETETASEPETISPEKQQYIEDIRQENEYEKPEVDLNKKTGKLSVEYYQTLESDANRRSWIEQGGILKGKYTTVNYSFTSFDNDDFELTMHGFGVTSSYILKWVKPPNYLEGKNLWTAFSLGFGGSMNITFGSTEMEMIDIDYSTWPWTTYTYNADLNMTLMSIELSIPVGYTFGLGRYFTSESWKGLMLGLYWKPNSVLTSMTMEFDGEYMDPQTESQMNFGGFQWTIDFGDFGALADKLAKEAHFSINGFIIPETDETPFMMSIGVGVVWY